MNHGHDLPVKYEGVSRVQQTEKSDSGQDLVRDQEFEVPSCRCRTS